MLDQSIVDELVQARIRTRVEAMLDKAIHTEYVPLEERKMRTLTPDEIRVLNALGDAWDTFLDLPVLHKEDQTAFVQTLHTAQNIVLGRPAFEWWRGPTT